MQQLTTLFLSQSYKDAWDDYARSLNKDRFACWDYVILTASNEQQADGFRAQIARRQEMHLLPARTQFVVIPDPDGKRVGSGGATLNVLKTIAEMEGNADFSGKRILVIHSGGDSKRVPQYSALGKLFSPVPHSLPNGQPSTIFDEFMFGMSGVPGRMRQGGMLLLSGDVLLLFNSLQIDFSGSGAAVISFKEHVETGKNHGVFLMGEDGNVARFLHKQTVETLTQAGAVNEQGSVDIDTGAILFSAELMRALYGMVCRDGALDPQLYDQFVNETTRLSLYGDFLYPMATDSTLEDFYLQGAEGEFCPELTAARTVVWQVLRPYRMKLLRLSPARFVHFGTTREIVRLLSHEIDHYMPLGWSRQVNSSISRDDVAAYNSVLSGSAQCGSNCYLEVSYVHAGARLGNNVVLSYVDIHDEIIPDDVILHGLKQKDGRFVVRIYGMDNNPKGMLDDGCTLFDGTLRAFMDQNGISEDELWDANEARSLWTARLYPACDSIQQAVGAALNIHRMAHGCGDVQAWRAAQRVSLCSGFNAASSEALIAWDQRMQELVQMDNVLKMIRAGKGVEEVRRAFNIKSLTKIQRESLDRAIAQADFSTRIRLYYYIGQLIGGSEGERYIDACFACIRSGLVDGMQGTLRYNPDCRIQRDEQVVQLPLRVNWGGGWSDTPPYCNECGGTVLNAALQLDGKNPVTVTLRRLDAHKIVFDSRDMDVHGEYDSIEELQNTGDPYDPFALQKAALIACGVIPASGGDLDEILSRMGGGFFMSTEVTGVPKGSGLGTSSILAGACVKALFEFTGTDYSEDQLYDHVLCMEQLMSTGGGWQDQIGGLSSGIKYISSRPGMHQQMRVEHIHLDDATMQTLSDRFALIYTGQRRLARNLLRDIVGKYIGNRRQTVEALSEIQKVAALMRFELERGNVDGFAALLNRHWDLSRQIDEGSSNVCIDQIFLTIDDLIDGRMICGAGGGGFLQVILKKGVTRSMLQDRLYSVFQDSGVRVWDARLI